MKLPLSTIAFLAVTLPACGRFIMRGQDAELTLFGSGVPILASERGKLVAH